MLSIQRVDGKNDECYNNDNNKVVYGWMDCFL